MSSEEPPAGQQPNPYGPPPGSGPPGGAPWGPPQQPAPQWGPPHGTSPYSQPPYGPPSGDPTIAPWQAPQPPSGGGGRRTGLIALIVVLVLLVAGGGTAIALVARGDDANDDARERSSEPTTTGGATATDSASTDASSAESSSPDPSEPESSDSGSGDDGGPAAPGAGPDTSLFRSSPRAADYQDDWEFRWEDTTMKARAVVARDHPDCGEVAADGELVGLGCNKAVTATYVNERDQVTITHYFLRFEDRAQAQEVKAIKKLDSLLKIEGDAVWEDWEQGGWRASQVKRFVVLTAVTAPKDADEQTVADYLRWSHTDFSLALKISKGL